MLRRIIIGLIFALALSAGPHAQAGTPTTWNTCAAGTRSNNNFTLTSTGSGGFCLATTTIASTSGQKVYFEVEWTTINNSNSSAGISNSGGTHYGSCQGGGNIQINGSTVDSCFGALQGVWLQYAIDFSTLKFWVRNPPRNCTTCWNGKTTGNGDPTVGVETGGETLTADSYLINSFTGSSGDVIVLNPGNNGAFQNFIPSGYQSWDGAVNPPGSGMLILQGCCVMRDEPDIIHHDYLIKTSWLEIRK